MEKTGKGKKRQEKPVERGRTFYGWKTVQHRTIPYHTVQYIDRGQHNKWTKLLRGTVSLLFEHHHHHHLSRTSSSVTMVVMMTMMTITTCSCWMTQQFHVNHHRIDSITNGGTNNNTTTTTNTIDFCVTAAVVSLYVVFRRVLVVTRRCTRSWY